MAAEGNVVIVRYIYRGEVGEVIPDDVTHVIVAEDVTVILREVFWEHRNLVEVICHDKVEKIERLAFCRCRSLRRVIMPGVKIAEESAFFYCLALTDVECGKLEIMELSAFCRCKSLRGINLPSARIVGENAFGGCTLSDVKFGSKLERIEGYAFNGCRSLERVTIPLKDGIIARDTFIKCENLRHVDLVEEVHETVKALNFEEWKNDINERIHSINQILPTAPAGDGWDEFYLNEDYGEKAQAIRRWIRSVLGKINSYKEEHQHVLDEAAITLQPALPRDILMNDVLRFLELPSHTSEGDEEMEGS